MVAAFPVVLRSLRSLAPLVDEPLHPERFREGIRGDARSPKGRVGHMKFSMKPSHGHPKTEASSFTHSLRASLPKHLVRSLPEL